jgi:hypothetical protein
MPFEETEGPKVTAFEDKDKADSSQGELPGLVATIKDRFTRAEDARYRHEQRWLNAYRNYRGIYNPSMQWHDEEQSRVFIKITKTKVIASYGQILDVLFSNNKIPLTVEPTKVPEGVAEYVNVQPEGLAEQVPEVENLDVYGFDGDGKDLQPGATRETLLGGLQSKYEGLNIQEGPSPDKTKFPQLQPAKIAAKNMEKIIHDQLDEANAQTVLRHSIFEMVLLGHCIIKGPFNYDKTVNDWRRGDNGGIEHFTRVKTIPLLEAVSIWDFYPDPDAVIIEDAEWVIQRHGLNRSQFRDLRNRPFFRESAIEECLAEGPNYEKRGYEDSLKNDESGTEFNQQRFEVLEYWGILDKDLVEKSGFTAEDLDIDVEDFDELDEFQVNAWICGGRVLRLVLNPFTPVRLPYISCPYEINPYQFWGVGLPENMEDTQMVMNGHARMAIDNLKLAGNLVFDVDETQLVPGQSMKIYPGKIFRRQTGQPGQAIHGIKFPSTATDNMLFFDKFRQLADEETGIPSFSHGQTGVTATTRTAAGMSMLFGAAALSVKTVVKNVDDFILRPLGESLFHWNMQFNNDDIEIRGDLEIRARGVSSLLQKEVRSQRLLTLGQVAANPLIAPFLKWDKWLSEVATELEIDPEKFVNNPEEAALFATMMAKQAQQLEGSSPTGPEGQTGAGNTGDVGSAAGPSEPGFTGTPQLSNGQTSS